MSYLNVFGENLRSHLAKDFGKLGSVNHWLAMLNDECGCIVNHELAIVNHEHLPSLTIIIYHLSSLLTIIGHQCLPSLAIIINHHWPSILPLLAIIIAIVKHEHLPFVSHERAANFTIPWR